VAESDHPAGPYKYLGSVKPNGAMSRDMTVFQDDDGKAYLFFASENNATMHVNQLSENYLSPTEKYTRILINAEREAPAVFKYNGKYYLITSACTGWSPNEATWSVADSPLGPWQGGGNPSKGRQAETTFQSQSTFVVPVPGKTNSFVFMADRWNKYNLEDSRYIWLPLTMKNGQPEIQWMSSWKLQ
jgi:beta-xylosidase